MKEWIVIHKIKALYDGGEGSSIRQIAQTLGLSRNTVRAYLALEPAAIESSRNERRAQLLDAHRDYILYLLETFPRLSAVKVKRKLEAKFGPLDASSRTVRRVIRALRSRAVEAQRRYYEPVAELPPGIQCQVDPGERHDVLIGGVATSVYFVVFVLAYSRLMAVGTSRQPMDTECFIRLHDAAFRAFGGCPEECVYDQTRLVVLDEQYRELTLNPRFAQYATTAGFRIRACEGYDPESKGKVEAGVKYVQQDGLYGEVFADWSAMEQSLQQWLDEVANRRIHGTTGETPQSRYNTVERAQMRPYLTPKALPSRTPGERRKVDKTGLISFRGNKYSVPMAYQSGQVNVEAAPEGRLHLYTTEGTWLASHPLSQGKGVLTKNGDHYRDKSRDIAALEGEIVAALGESGRALCDRLAQTDTPHYKDKLRGVKRHLSRLQALPEAIVQELAQKEQLRVSTLLDYLSAWEVHPERWAERGTTMPPAAADTASHDLLHPYAGLTAGARS